MFKLYVLLYVDFLDLRVHMYFNRIYESIDPESK